VLDRVPNPHSDTAYVVRFSAPEFTVLCRETGQPDFAHFIIDYPLVVRKATLTSVLAKAGAGIRFNEHMEFDDSEVVFNHACKLGLEGIVSKRKDSTYRSGNLRAWGLN
jgi:hypothetical protein